MRLDEVILRGTRAGQPAATTVAAGTLYYVTDELKTERSTGSAWQDVSDGVTAAPHPLLGSTEHNDTLTGTVVRGDVIVGNSTPKWSRKAKGTSGQLFTMLDGNDPGWADAPATGVPDPVLTCLFWEDFLTFDVATSGTTPTWTSFGTGTPGQKASETNHPGIFTNSVSGVGGINLNSQLACIDFAALFDMTWVVRITSNSSVKLRAGLIKSTASTTGDPPSDWLGIEFIAGTDTNFQGVTRASSTSTRTDTGIAANTNFNKFRIRRIDASTIGFTVNAGTEVTSTTNIPTGFGIVECEIVPTSGSKILDVDLFKLAMPVTR